MDNVEQKEPAFSETEKTVLNNARTMLENCSNLILMTKNTISQAWYIKVQKDKTNENKNPFEDFIDMLNFYIKQAKEDYAHYCQENNLDATSEQKELIDDLNKAKESSEAKFEPIVQIKKLIME